MKNYIYPTMHPTYFKESILFKIPIHLFMEFPQGAVSVSGWHYDLFLLKFKHLVMICCKDAECDAASGVVVV